jgi:hypothetical protein
MSLSPRKLASLATAFLAALILCVAASQSFAHDHGAHHGVHAGHAAHVAVQSGERPEPASAAKNRTGGQHGHHDHHERQHHERHHHERHGHGPDCPSLIIDCDCGGIGCCEHPAGAAVTLAGANRWKLLTSRAFKPLRLVPPTSTPSGEPPPPEDRPDWWQPTRTSDLGWRAKLYSDSPRLRI